MLEKKRLNFIFEKCYSDTFKNAVKYLDNDDVFVATGDIPAMWLRDSSAQVMVYLNEINKPEIQKLIKNIILKQFSLIQIDPYANAFKENEKQDSQWKDYVKSDYIHPLVWERKFELDSLCYPLFLLTKYYEKTSDLSLFNDEFFKTFDIIIKTCELERKHSLNSDYFFYRKVPWRDIPEDVGKNNNPEGEKGLVWSGFRPSDDACKYNFHIPDNMFLVSVLYKLEKILRIHLKDEKRSNVCKKMVDELSLLIDQYGVSEIDGIGKVYVLETDCLGHYVFDDDANIPSLLSIPYLEYPFINNIIYKNTRKYILSKRNKYYYEGRVLKGIGSPHTPKDYVWPLSIIMQGLTAETMKEKNECLELLMNSITDNDLIHESVNVDDPSKYTRQWFCWANSLFAEFILSFKEKN